MVGGLTTAKFGDLLRRKPKRFKLDKWFSISKLLGVILVLSFLLFSMTTGTIFLVFFNLDRSSDIIKVSMITDMKFVDLLRLFELHSYLSVYGDGLKVGESYLSSHLQNASASYPTIQFASHLIDIRGSLAEQVNRQDLQKIEAMYYGELCEILGQGEPEASSVRGICSSRIDTKYGIVGFIPSLSDYFVQTRLLVHSNPTRLITSRSSPLQYDLDLALFTPDRLKSDILSFAMISGATRLRLQVSLESAYAALDRSSAYIDSLLMTTVPALIITALLASTVGAIKLLTRDMSVCVESIRNIMPASINQNKLVFMLFNQVYKSYV